MTAAVAAKRKNGRSTNGKHPDPPHPPSPEASQRALLAALRSVAKGDFSVRLSTAQAGIDGDIAEAFNDLVAMNARLLAEFQRISAVVGRDGRIAQRAHMTPAPGAWSTYITSVNELIDDLTHPIAETSRVLGSVARGDLSQQMVREVDGRPLKGEFLRSCNTINTMVDQLNSFAFEVTRVAREVGSEGKLGGQAQVQGVAGTWKDLTDSRQLDGRQPHEPSPQHRRSHHRRRQRRPLEEDHGRRARRDPRAQRHHQHDGRPAQRRSPRKSPASPAKSAPKGSSAVKPRSAASPGRGRTSPTRSTRWPAT